MTNERYNQLMNNEDSELTQEEINQGWHFCFEFDGLLRNNNEEDHHELGFKCDCL